MTIFGPLLARDTDADGDVDQIVVVLRNSLDGAVVNLTTTADSNKDGVLSAEAIRDHTVVIAYIDTTQRVRDVAWTKAGVGQGDGDNLLETAEKIEITVSPAGLTTALTRNKGFSV